MHTHARAVAHVLTYTHVRAHTRALTNTHPSCTWHWHATTLHSMRKPSKLHYYHARDHTMIILLLYTESIVFPSPKYIHALQNHSLEYNSAFCVLFMHIKGLTTSLEGLSISVAYHWSGKKWQGIEWQTTQVCTVMKSVYKLYSMYSIDGWPVWLWLSTLASSIKI